MQLFMVYLGGRVSGCHIEMHDIRFVIGSDISHTYQQLKNQWVGDKNHVHIDSYMAIKHIGGYQVGLSQTPPKNQSEKLYFVNLGAYQADKLAEQHAFTLVVATSAEQAKAQAKQQLLVNMQHQHKDNLHEVDDCFALDLFEQHYITLTPSGQSQKIQPDWFGYHVL